MRFICTLYFHVWIPTMIGYVFNARSKDLGYFWIMACYVQKIWYVSTNYWNNYYRELRTCSTTARRIAQNKAEHYLNDDSPQLSYVITAYQFQEQVLDWYTESECISLFWLLPADHVLNRILLQYYTQIHSKNTIFLLVFSFM